MASTTKAAFSLQIEVNVSQPERGSLSDLENFALLEAYKLIRAAVGTDDRLSLKDDHITMESLTYSVTK